MASVNFLYRSKKAQAYLSVRLLYRFNEKDYVIGSKTKLIVNKNYWFDKHRLKRLKDIDLVNVQKSINTELANIELLILENFSKINPMRINKDWLNNIIDHYYNDSIPNYILPEDLVSFITYYIEQRKNEVSASSVTKFNVIKHKLERYQKKKNQILLLHEVNEEFKTNWVEFCKSEQYSLNTIQRELNIIKTFCKYARSQGLQVSPQLDTLRLKKEKVNHIYLSFEELIIIEKAKLEKEYLENARDWLIISCYVGQRISDFMRFVPDMIREEDGKKLIEFSQKKTSKIMTIPIHPKVQKILDSREGEFPRQISHQRYNEYIKDVCEIAGLDTLVEGKIQENITGNKENKKMRAVNGNYPKYQLITSHIGRRSFASNFYGKIPTSFLIYVTGHSTESMFLNYIGKSNKDMAIELAKYF